MRHPGFAAVALAAGLLLAPAVEAADRGAAATGSPPGGAALPSSQTQDRDFLHTAAPLLRTEIDISRLGAERATDPQVKALSQRMVQAYGELQSKLEAGAGKAGMAVPDLKDPHGVNRLGRLEDTTSQFDLTYIDEQRSLHEKLAGIFAMEAKAGQNPALKGLGADGQALLTGNLKEIEQLESRLREARTSR
jgi:predicted outer membrane protein